MKIIFLADGNTKLGMGHVFRSLNLAKTFRKNNHKIIFITKDQIAKDIISEKFECKLISQNPTQSLNKILEKFLPDVIILDKLNETKKFLLILKKFCPIVGIDYTGKHKELINYAINILYPETGKTKLSYSNINYAVLNEKFLKNHKRQINKKVNSILILQGGADTHCFTPKILQSVIGANQDFKISIVLGPSFDCCKKLEPILNSNKDSIRVFQNVKNISTIMKKSDLAITAAGNTLLELAFLGIPSLVISAEKFEIQTAKLLEKYGFGINAGYGGNLSQKQITIKLLRLVDDYSTRLSMNKIGPKLVDGKGASRILKIIENEIVSNLP